VQVLPQGRQGHQHLQGFQVQEQVPAKVQDLEKDSVQVKETVQD